MREVAFAVLALCALAALPLVASDYVVGIGVTAFTFTIAAASLNLIYGYAGLLSFAQLAFWGIGGYCTALVVMDAGGSFWTGLALAAALNAALALVVGWAALRLERHSFVIVTLSFSLLTWLVSRDWVDVTRGPLGLPGLPVPSLFGFPFSTTARYYWLALAFLVVCLALLYLIVTSRIGRTLLALKQNQPLALAHGVSPTPYKLFAFSVSAALTGVAGGIQVFYLRIVDPSILDFYYLQAWLIMVIIGGAGTFWGVVVAGLVMSALPEALRFSNELRMVIYGAILVAAVLVMPQGVAGWIRERRIARLRESLEPVR
ncbi:MAG TPA: branched-chain amino acid ABC transporter permease [Burkholderiaceae bacterium]|jgi:ABC-type branched-subunit amino acid transport system permease subunit|nr:branched-chain amino acid ABC transporter permease [Burkholderiaceae bacterium]